MKASSIALLIATGVKPSEIKFLAISHTDPDHIGNVELLPQSMLPAQRGEDGHLRRGPASS
jgi:glyoxylase-like metal-dependent hydrolase (beta-lactamase superfamily II)